jgi:type IV pilus assembly protein PilA
MNNVFTAKLLQNLQAKKKGNKGFTLIELLVVVIIIGVLAAIALPNLLGQVGKAREAEAKTALGAMNRAQQAYHLEGNKFFGESSSAANDFAETQAALGVVPGTEFYEYGNLTAAGGDASNGKLLAIATNPDNNGNRDFAAGVNYNAGAFKTALCVATSKATGATRTTAAPGSSITVVDVVPANSGTTACTTGNVIK